MPQLALSSSSTTSSSTEQKNSPKEIALEVVHLLEVIKAKNNGTPVRDTITKLKNNSFSHEELLTICVESLGTVEPYCKITEKIGGQDLHVGVSEEFKELMLVILKISNALADYKITGMSPVSNHASLQVFYGRKTIKTPIIFKNDAGDFVKKTFEFKHSSIGWQNEFLWNISCVISLDTHLDLFSIKKTMELGKGLSVGYRIPMTGPRIPNVEANLFIPNDHGRMRTNGSYPFVTLGLTYLPLANSTGGFLIVHLGIGLTGFTPTANMLTCPTAINASLVTNATVKILD